VFYVYIEVLRRTYETIVLAALCWERADLCAYKLYRVIIFACGFNAYTQKVEAILWRTLRRLSHCQVLPSAVEWLVELFLEVALKLSALRQRIHLCRKGE
jgi:hypothetical protein